MRFYFFGFLSFIFSFLLEETYAQNPEIRIQHFGFEEGLSSRIVYNIYQDAKGFIWIGTDYGLNRFDGQEFKVYTKKGHDLSNNKIPKIVSDNQGMIWLTPNRASFSYEANRVIDVFDPIEEVSVPLLSWIKNPEIIVKQQILETYVSHKGNVFVTTVQGNIYRYQDQALHLAAQLPNQGKLHHLEEDDDGIWITAQKHIYFFDTDGNIQLTKALPKNKKGKQYIHPRFLPSQSTDYIDYSYGPSGPLTVKESYQIRRLYKNGKDSLILQTPLNTIFLFADTELQELGVVLGDGYQFSMIPMQSTLDNPTPWGIETRHNTNGFPRLWDRQKGFWYIDHAKGIFRTARFSNLFKRYLYQHSIGFRKTTPTRGVAQDDSGNIFVCIPQSNRVEQLVVDSLGHIQKERLPISRGMYYSILLDGQQLYIGGYSGLLVHYAIDKKQVIKEYSFDHKKHPTSTITSSLIIWSIFKDSRNQLWTGHQQGISYLDTADANLHLYTKLNGFDALKKATVYHFHENSEGIWVLSSTGLYLLDPQQGIVAHYHPKGDEQHYLPHQELFHLHEDSDGYFWLATKGGGLIKWHPQTKQYEQFTTQNGLSHNIVYAVYPDDYNQLWLSSNRGIMRFHKESHFVTTYLAQDGITHEEFNRAAHFQATDGTIYFGGLDGATAFHPKDFQTDGKLNAYRPEITEFRVQDGSTGEWKNRTASLIKTQQITLQPDDLGFSMKFTSLDFKNLNKQQFAYFIEDFDKNWTHQKHNFIRINRLPYGSFRLLLKAQNSDGVWSEPLVMNIEIVKPIYLRTWFILLAIIILSLAVFAFIKWRIHRLEANKKNLELEVEKRTQKIEKDRKIILHQKEELAKLDQLKSRFFANISHELRTPLSLILGPAKHVRETFDQLDVESIKSSFLLIEQNSENLLQLVEELLELSRLESNQVKVHLSAVQLPQLLARLYSNFDSHAQYLNIQLELENWPNEQAISLDVNKVEKIINNLISNALKFTPKGGNIRLKAVTVGGQIQISVTDTGKGIHPDDLPHLFERFFQSKQINGIEQGGTGIGLALAKELAEVMGGSVSIESELGKGSCFTLTLPLLFADKEAETHDFPTSNQSVSVMPTQQNASPKEEELGRLLIVEDNLSMQQFIAGLLKDDYAILSAKNGKEAQALLSLENQSIDLIISDVMMPEMDGFTFLTWLKSTNRWRTTPVVMLTARAAEEDKLKALTIGVDDYLTKPFSHLELKTRVSNLLAHAHARKEWIIENEINNQNQHDIPYLPDVESSSITEGDLKWIAKVADSFKQQLADSNFSISNVADEYKLSERQFFRRIKKITGLSPVKYRQEIQLHTSRELLENGEFSNLADVSHAVGFHTARYFSRLFVDRFGKKPNDYLV